MIQVCSGGFLIRARVCVHAEVRTAYLDWAFLKSVMVFLSSDQHGAVSMTSFEKSVAMSVSAVLNFGLDMVVTTSKSITEAKFTM